MFQLKLGCFRTLAPVASQEAEADVPSLSLRRTKLELQYAYSNPRKSAYRYVFQPLNEPLFSKRPALLPLGIRLKKYLAALDFDVNHMIEQRIGNISLHCLSLDVKSCLIWTDRISLTLVQISMKVRSHSNLHVAANSYLEDCSVLARLPKKTSIYTAELTCLLLALVTILSKTRKEHF